MDTLHGTDLRRIAWAHEIPVHLIVQVDAGYARDRRHPRAPLRRYPANLQPILDVLALNAPAYGSGELERATVEPFDCALNSSFDFHNGHLCKVVCILARKQHCGQVPQNPLL